MLAKTDSAHNISLNIVINLQGVGGTPKAEAKEPISKEEALAVNIAPPDPFLDPDKIAKKLQPGLGPIVDGEYFPPTEDGLRAAKQKRMKKRISDYYDDQSVIYARKMLKGD